MAKAERPIAGVRVGVKNGGCAGMEYTMEYAESVGPTDEVVEDKGVKLLIDPKAVLFLLGTEMDCKVDKLSSQFVFNNPNQTSACGCGESVQLTPAKDATTAPRRTRLRRRCVERRRRFRSSPNCLPGSARSTVRRMFSGAGVFADGLMIALVVDGVIYLKADDEHHSGVRAGRAWRRSATRPGTASAR